MPHTYLFMTNLRFERNGFIFLYQDIHDNLENDPTNDITSNIRKGSIELNVYFKLLACPLFMR